MPKRNTESQQIAYILQDMISGSKLERGLNKVLVESVWHEVMGPPISKYTKSIKWSPPILYIYLGSTSARDIRIDHDYNYFNLSEIHQTPSAGGNEAPRIVTA